MSLPANLGPRNGILSLTIKDKSGLSSEELIRRSLKGMITK